MVLIHCMSQTFRQHIQLGFQALCVMLDKLHHQQVLPSDWVNTDEVYGSNNNAGSGSDATDNFQVSVSRSSGGTNVTGLNFGADQLPSSDNKTASEMNPGGTSTVTCPSFNRNRP
jgi:hypothetical protein